MLQHFQTLKNNFPPVHLAAASICGLILGITLLLLPSENVSATRELRDHKSAPERTSNSLALQFSNAHTQENTPASLIAHEQGSSTDQTPDNWVIYSVQKDDNLTSLFRRAGLSAQDVHYVSQATSKGKELSRLYPGEKLAFQVANGRLKKIKYQVNALKTIVIESLNPGAPHQYQVRTIERTPETRERFTEVSIHNSLFSDAASAGLSDNMIMRFASIFSWDIDFSQDIHNGDSVRIIYNEQFLDGKKIRDGNIVAAQFISQGKTYTAVRYTDSDGRTRYYTPEGHSMRKAFLRMPVDFARISSRFKLSRKHPVLNKIRAHKGVDYAAKTGTPIKASGDGKVIWLGTKGGYGRTIIIEHGGKIQTLYAHMSKYNTQLKKGSRVKQGQTIGYIGSSGLATGPHLHYEFRVDGTHKNPMTVKFPQAEPVASKERLAFRQIANQMMAQLETYSVRYASAQ
jgi:murein DD-endopeptidase MepM/ murein hydrolase activator NlpD